MTFDSQRTVESPSSVVVSITIDEAALTAAFQSAVDPDEQLFFELFGPKWHERPISERLFTLARVAALAEGARAKELNLTSAPPEPKKEPVR